MKKQYKINKTKRVFLNSLKEILMTFDQDYSEVSCKNVWLKPSALKCFVFYTFLSNTIILDTLLKMGVFHLKGKNLDLNWL